VESTFQYPSGFKMIINQHCELNTYQGYDKKKIVGMFCG